MLLFNYKILEGGEQMLKKLLTVFSMLSLVFLLSGEFSDYSVSASAEHNHSATNDSDHTLTSTRSRTISVYRLYQLTDTIPATINYNQRGWSGTLRRQSIQRDPGGQPVYIVHYSGTVSCHGTCVLPSTHLLD